MTLTPIIRSGPAALGDLRLEWSALWEADPTASLFHRPEFMLAWWDEFGAGRMPHVIELRDGDVLRGLALVLVEEGTLRFLGDAEVTDYLGPIGVDRDAVADVFARAIADIDGWSTAELHCIATDTGWHEALARAAKATGLTVDEQRRDVCPRIDLPGDFDAYLATLPPKQRHEVRRKTRKLERETGGFTIRLTTSETLGDDLRRFFAMHRSSDGPKGKFLNEGLESFFTALARNFDECGWLRMSWLDVDEEPWAGVLSFVERGIWSVYNSVYDHAKRDFAPGIVLMTETIRLAIDESCTVFDLLRGDEPYKYRLGGKDVALVQLTFRQT